MNAGTPRKAGASWHALSRRAGGSEVRGFLADDPDGERHSRPRPGVARHRRCRRGPLAATSTPLQSHAAPQAAPAHRPGEKPAFERIDSPCAWQNHQNLGAGAIPARSLERLVSLLS